MGALQAEGLFCSVLQPSDATTPALVRDTVHAVVFAVGQAEVEARVAQEFGDHPEAACRRMRWCVAEVELAFVPAGAR